MDAQLEDFSVQVRTGCDHDVEFDRALLEASASTCAMRCTVCGQPCSTRALVTAARLALLQQLSDRPPDSLTVLSELDVGRHSWLEGGQCELETYGLIVGRGAVCNKSVGLVRTQAEAALDLALTPPHEAAQSFLRKGIREPTGRYDLMMQLTPQLRRLLCDLVAEDRPLGSAIETALGGTRATLCECSCIITADGARSQAVHCDTMPDDDNDDDDDDDDTHRDGSSTGTGTGTGAGAGAGAGPGGGSACSRLLTAFVALHDLDPLMGPTLMWPRTHTLQFHRRMNEHGPLVLRSMPSIAMTLAAGDAVLMDSRLWHSGLANVSGRRRVLLVATFAAPGACPDGSTYSLLPELEGKHTVGSLRTDTNIP